MATIYTADASVFLNAFNPYEVGHDDSRRLLARLQEQGVPIIVPTLLLPEVAAAVDRGRNNPAWPGALPAWRFDGSSSDSRICPDPPR